MLSHSRPKYLFATRENHNITQYPYRTTIPRAPIIMLPYILLI